MRSEPTTIYLCATKLINFKRQRIILVVVLFFSFDVGIILWPLFFESPAAVVAVAATSTVERKASSNGASVWVRYRYCDA